MKGLPRRVYQPWKLLINEEQRTTTLRSGRTLKIIRPSRSIHSRRHPPRNTMPGCRYSWSKKHRTSIGGSGRVELQNLVFALFELVKNKLYTLSFQRKELYKIYFYQLKKKGYVHSKPRSSVHSNYRKRKGDRYGY